MAIKRGLQRVAERLGYYVVPRWQAPDFHHSLKLRRIFDRYAISSVLDVGANRGQFRALIRAGVGFRGSIHSFEPIGALAAEMERRRGPDRNWKIHNYALGSKGGKQEINIMAAAEFSSFHQPRREAAFGGKNAVASTEPVDISTLDEVVPTLDLDLSHTFLKIDTQGWDLEVAKGGRSVLAKVPALQTEVSVRPLYDDVPDWLQAMEFFRGLGFSLCDLYIAASDQQMRAMEFDCLMVRP